MVLVSVVCHCFDSTLFILKLLFLVHNLYQRENGGKELFSHYHLTKLQSKGVMKIIVALLQKCKCVELLMQVDNLRGSIGNPKLQNFVR